MEMGGQDGKGRKIVSSPPPTGTPTSHLQSNYRRDKRKTSRRDPLRLQTQRRNHTRRAAGRRRRVGASIPLVGDPQREGNSTAEALPKARGLQPHTEWALPICWKWHMHLPSKRETYFWASILLIHLHTYQNDKCARIFV